MSEKGEVLVKGKVSVDREIGLEQYMKTTQIGMSTVMIDRQKIPDLKFPEERELCEDARAWVSLFHRGYRFHGLNEVLLLYRVRQNHHGPQHAETLSARGQPAGLQTVVLFPQLSLQRRQKKNEPKQSGAGNHT